MEALRRGLAHAQRQPRERQPPEQVVVVAVGGREPVRLEAGLPEHARQRVELVREVGRVHEGSPRRGATPRRGLPQPAGDDERRGAPRLHAGPGQATFSSLAASREGPDLGRGLLLPRLELLAAAVDPDHAGDPGLQRGLDVGGIAAADVDPVLLRALDAPRTSLKWAGSGLYERTCCAVTTRSKSTRKWRRVAPSSLSSMFGSAPISNFFAKRSGWALVSRKGGQAGTLLGRKFRADRLEVPAQLLRHAHGGTPQDLGVELVEGRAGSRAGRR